MAWTPNWLDLGQGRGPGSTSPNRGRTFQSTAAAGTLVTSERERRQLVTYGAPVDVHVVPLPVSGPPRPGDASRFRRKFGIPDDVPLVLFLSRIDPKKGLERLLQAAQRWGGSHP